MPGYDKTGPMGAGPMTGGRWGYCNPVRAGRMPVYSGGYGYGRGLGLRRGFRCRYDSGMGRGYGHPYGWYPPATGPFYPPVYPQPASGEIDRLKAQADFMKNALDEINRRIDALKKESSGSS